MNPLANGMKAEEAAIEPPTPAPIDTAAAPAELIEDETPVYDDGYVEDAAPMYAENADVIEDEVIEHNEPIEEAPAFIAAAETADAYRNDTQPDVEDRSIYDRSQYSRDHDGEYYVTVIQEKNGNQRNLLLLAATFLVLTTAVSATVVSLFQKDLGIGAIGDERSLAYLIDEVPTTVEEEVKQLEKEKGGGGGGGGKNEKEETSQGDLAPQQKNPIRPPDVNTYRSDNFELKTPTPSTEGTRKFDKVYDRWGDPNSKFAGLSNGTGSGGGQGSGIGTGQGSGYGTGAGSGSGSGSGSGVGDGDGPGSGSGGNRAPAPPPPVGVTSSYKILAKPQARYNDAGRTNGIQGTVRLKITLLASGQVGSITPVTRLPHGLTEQAIAAARQLKFEPKKVNGVPVATIVNIDYTFSIY